MKIKMLMDTFGTSNESGNATRNYAEGEIIDCDVQWKKDLANNFMTEGKAIEVKVDAPKEKKSEPKITKKKSKKKVTKK
tara:strand:- start:117 stop:353 length:237 start_codon:yes stop_codon:yes gene_type:complete